MAARSEIDIAQGESEGPDKPHGKATALFLRKLEGAGEG